MMTNDSRTVLITDDDPDVRAYLETLVSCIGFTTIVAQDGEEALARLRESPHVSAVLLDVIMPRRDGIETLREIKALRPSLPVVMVSEASSVLNVVQAMKIGADDFVSKPVSPAELRRALANIPALAAPAPVEEHKPVSGVSGQVFFGRNPAMREVLQMLRLVAPSSAPVLIQGETGVGKEVIAKELRALSTRARERFIKLNCAALPSELVESELFGYERGAFTGAFQKKLGMFELADNGTIMLDEIGDMDLKLQAKLLQVLQDREFHRIGGKEMIKVDVRVISATHRDLERAIEDRQFREDLYYRLNVISVEIPPLRARKEDLIEMARFFIEKHAIGDAPVITAEMEQVFLDYNWPGNVRELENVMRRYVILKRPDLIVSGLRAKMLRGGIVSRTVEKPQPRDKAAVAMCEPAEVDDIEELSLAAVVAGPPIARAAASNGYRPAEPPPLEHIAKANQEAEAAIIINALEKTRWNRKRAAAALNIHYKALLYKMKKLGIDSAE